MFTQRYTEQELADRHFRKTIPPKWEVYYLIVASGRCLGYRRTPKCGGRWVARLRVTTGSNYREQVMGLADDTQRANGRDVLTYEDARQKALQWFNLPKFSDIKVDDRPTGWRASLNVCPIGEVYTVAHAMQDYCRWKQDFGARQSFHAAVSRANVYTLPLLGSIPCEELTAQQCRSLLLFVEGSILHRTGGTRLEPVDPRTLDPEVRRKRRITATPRGSQHGIWRR
jgi:integrase/recombinase XerD